jgi:hypothetical protein
MQSNFWPIHTVLLALTGTAQAAGGQQTPPSSPGLFDFQGTPEEQAACSPDATKFCSDAIPDTFRVLACLQDHRKRLRKVCLQVLEIHGQ